MARNRVIRKPLLEQPMTSFAQLSAALFAFIIGNTLVVIVANMFFPQAVVLGNQLLTPFQGALYSMTIVALMAVGIIPIVEWVANWYQLNFSNTQWLALYWVLNAGAVWLVARFALIAGLGISSWLVAVVLGLVLNLVQGWLMANVVGRVD